MGTAWLFIMFFYALPDVFEKGVWPELQDIQDPELKDLAESLPLIVLHSKAPATVKKYSGAFSRWKRWATSKPGLEVFPAKPFQVALYLNFLARSATTSAPVEEAVNALSWAHQLAVVEDPTVHSLVRQVLAGTKRILPHRTVKKEPITAEILQKLYDNSVSSEADLSVIRTMAICLLGYAGFFRFSELASLRECDVKFYDDHLEVFVESSKTDLFRDGAWVPIARTYSDICPVSMLERYMKLGEIGGDFCLEVCLQPSRAIASGHLVESATLEFGSCCWKSWKLLGWTPNCLAYIVSGLEGRRRQLMRAYQIDCLSDMVDGYPRMLSMVMSRIHLMIDWL